jgi:hypothetical protein
LGPLTLAFLDSPERRLIEDDVFNDITEAHPRARR